MLRSPTARRVAMLPALVLVVLVMSFGLLFLVPGDPAVTLAGDDATPEQVQAIRSELGLDDPIARQFADYLGGVVTGDLGESLFSRVPVSELIGDRWPATVSLTVLALLFALIVAVPLAVVAAWRPGSLVDRAILLLTSGGLALPSFWIALVLLEWFALSRSWFPTIGYTPLLEDPWQWFRHLVLPASALSVGAAAEILRQLRGALGDVTNKPFVRTLEASGLPRRRILLRHGLKNAGIPAVTIAGFQVAALLGGTVVVERIFGLAGMGSLAADAVLQRDMPVVQGVVLVAAIAVLAVNLLVDLSYGYFNPKLRGVA